MEASKGAIAISVKPAAVRMRATRPRSPNENGPGASGSGGAVGGTTPLIAPIGRRTQSFSAAPRQQTKATRPPARSARRIWANAPVGSLKNITPNRENSMSNAPSGSSALLASATRNRAGVSCGASARARAISGSDRSTPSTWPAAPTRSARARLDAPAPQPTSSTRSPVAGAAASIAAWPNTASLASSRAWWVTQRSPLWLFQSASRSALCCAMTYPCSDAFLTRLSLRLRNESRLSLASDRQPELLSQTLVECGGGDETAQDRDLARQFARRIAPFRSAIGRSRQNGLGYHFGRIAFLHRFPYRSSHGCARRVIDIQKLVRLREILFESRAGIG